jgi:hypothetical protein
MKTESYRLHTVQTIIGRLREEIGHPLCRVAEGYLEACDDLEYACRLGEAALDSHLVLWCSHVPLNERDEGYVLACCDLAQALSELNDSEEWSFD